jgi:heme-degrading monooxygenase HmoA
MPLAVEHLSVTAGRQVEFERAFERAARLLVEAPGYVAHELHRSTDCETGYLLIVEWQRREDFTLRFRASTAFRHWHQAIHAFSSGDVDLEMFAIVERRHGPTHLLD